MEINELLKLMVDKRASDMHLRVPSPPVLRVDGVLVPQTDLTSMERKDVEMVFERITTPDQRSVFLKEKELDYAYSIPGLARFRLNIMRQRGTISIAFRLVPFEIPTIDDLGLPDELKSIITKPEGLILVTGPAGSGKSTTMAAIIDYLNKNEIRNIITVEDPIEYLYKCDKCIIAQRDIGDDTQSIDTALKHALQHDPDVIVIGDMEKKDTISTAIRAAEAGRLVLGVLYANSASQSIDRLLEAFPQEQQQVRAQLSRVLEAVISQKLVARISGGRVAAYEMLITDAEVRQRIREAETFQFSRNGDIQGMDRALVDLVKNGTISPDEAISKGNEPEKVRQLLQPKGKKVKAGNK
ncbi:type IV pilus twitching motility protein PilT [Chloroflexota bacterium]